MGVVAGYRGADHPPYPVTSSCDWTWSSSSELALKYKVTHHNSNGAFILTIQTLCAPVPWDPTVFKEGGHPNFHGFCLQLHAVTVYCVTTTILFCLQRVYQWLLPVQQVSSGGLYSCDIVWVYKLVYSTVPCPVSSMPPYIKKINIVNFLISVFSTKSVPQEDYK
jgi:hypothetical protein